MNIDYKNIELFFNSVLFKLNVKKIDRELLIKSLVGSSLRGVDSHGIRLFSHYNNRIIITCFSSNIARMESIAVAAKKNNRKVALIGRSMKKTIEAASKIGLIILFADVKYTFN